MPIKGIIHPADVVKKLIKDGNIKISQYPSVFVRIYRFLYARSRINQRISQGLIVIFPGTDVDFWLTLQKDYEISKLDEKIDANAIL